MMLKSAAARKSNGCTMAGLSRQGTLLANAWIAV
jgi:hypothetical protein